jgi:hypothetical protein
MLVFELNSEGDQLEIHADRSGLLELQKYIEQLLSRESHVHLKTAAWGGTELSEEPQQEGHRVLNHVKIFGW